MQPPRNASTRVSPRIRFSCEHCRQELSVDEAQAGIGGPCPRCGQWVIAPDYVRPPQDKDFLTRVEKIPAKGAHKHVPQFKSGHLMADSMVDREYQQRREIFRMLRIFAWIILVIGICLAAYWFLEKSMTR